MFALFDIERETLASDGSDVFEEFQWIGDRHFGALAQRTTGHDGSIVDFPTLVGRATEQHFSECGAVNRQALAHARAGNDVTARQVCDELSARAQHEDVPAYHMATAYAAVGLVDEAFAALERGCDDRDPTVFSMRTLEPDLFRGDPRFAGIVERVGIDPIGVDEGVNVGVEDAVLS